GYAFGGSGGGVRTISTMEAMTDLWHGGVPFMFNGSVFSVTLNAARLIQPHFNEIVDAVDAGGSGNPFEMLNTEQRIALAECYRAGFPRGAEFQLKFPMPEISWPG